MKPAYHIASSAVVSGALYFIYRSWQLSLSCFLSGVLIDVDHIFDYVRAAGLRFRFKDFVNAVYTNTKIRWMVVFHSWELIFLLLVAAWLTQWNPWFTGILIGFGHHIVLDTIYIRERCWTYSFIWRWKNNFEFKAIYPNFVKRRERSD